MISRGSINDELRRIGETYKSDFEIAKQRQGELEMAVAAAVSQSQETSQALTTLRDLESSAETYRGLYRGALQRGTELIQKQSFPGVEARLITRASTPTSQSSPKTLVVLCASAVGGILLGFAAGALRASLDRVFRTPAPGRGGPATQVPRAGSRGQACQASQAYPEVTHALSERGQSRRTRT